MNNDNVSIRPGNVRDLFPAKQIYDCNKNELGFVIKPMILESIEKRWFIVVEINEDIIGLCRFRIKKNKTLKLYEICIGKAYRRQGLASKLMDYLVDYSAPFHLDKIELKCPVGLIANEFYRNYGFIKNDVESPKDKRQLNIYNYKLNKKNGASIC